MRLIDADELRDIYLSVPNGVYTTGHIITAINECKTIDAVPLDKLCELLAEMYHCPSSGYPSSGHACHPDCTDEMLATICGMDCDHYSDSERWKAFLTNWMEGLDAAD